MNGLALLTSCILHNGCQTIPATEVRRSRDATLLCVCFHCKTERFDIIIPGPGCSKLTMSLVNVSLKFQMLISQTRQYFLLKNVRSFSFFSTKISVYLVIKL